MKVPTPPKICTIPGSVSTVGDLFFDLSLASMLACRYLGIPLTQDRRLNQNILQSGILLVTMSLL